MNDAQVQQQIQQMVSFIRQEADEKVNEMRVKAEEEFNIRKLSRVEEQRERIRLEYARKTKQIETSRKIARSTELNAARLKVLKAREDGLRAVYEEVRERLTRLPERDPERYRALLRGYIVQGLLELTGDRRMSVVCRPQDVDTVEALLSEAVRAFQDKARQRAAAAAAAETAEEGDEGDDKPKQQQQQQQQHSRVDNVHVEVDKREFLSKSTLGGLVLTSHDGKLRCENTLDSRLDIAYSQNLPMLRRALYGDAHTEGSAL